MKDNKQLREAVAKVLVDMAAEVESTLGEGENSATCAETYRKMAADLINNDRSAWTYEFDKNIDDPEWRAENSPGYDFNPCFNWRTSGIDADVTLQYYPVDDYSDKEMWIPVVFFDNGDIDVLRYSRVDVEVDHYDFR